MWAWVEKLLTDKQYWDQAIEEYRQGAAGQAAPIQAELAMTEASEVQLRQRLENLARAAEQVEDGEALEALAGRMKKVEAKLAAQARQRAKLTAKLEAAQF